MKKIINIYFCLSALSLYLGSCKPSTQQEQDILPTYCTIHENSKESMTFGRIKEQIAQYELDLTGNVSYDQDELFIFQSLVSGIVQETYFKLGDFVQKGEVLLEVRSPSIGEFRSTLKMAETDIQLATRNLKSIEKLYESGLASDRELLEAEREISEAQLNWRQIKESIQIYGGALEKDVLVIRAPQSGYIVQKNITRGSTIAEGNEEIFSISNLKKVWVQVNVYPAQINLLKEGDEVEISTSAYINERFKGKITRISNVFDPEEKVMKAIIEMNNEDLKLKPDMMVNVHLIKKTSQKALSIPIEAVLFDKNQYHLIWTKDSCSASILTFQPLGKDKRYYYFNTSIEGFGAESIYILKNNLLIYNELNNQ